MQAQDPQRLLASHVEARRFTDYRFEWLSYAGWCVLTLGFYSYYGLYRLIERRGEHMRRRLAFSASLWHTLAARADAAGKREDVQAGLDNLSRVHATLEEFERRNRRDATLLTMLRLIAGILFGGINAYANVTEIDFESDTGAVIGLFLFVTAIAVGVIGTYTNHVLNADLRFVETWENALFDNADWVMRKVGVEAPPRSRHKELPKRETALYVVLTIVSVGLFAIVWRAMMMLDGNAHFEGDDRAEDALLWSLGIPSGTQVPAPPA